MSEQPVKKPHDGMNRVPARKEYSTPRLTVYGDLRRLTAGGTRNRNEAGGSGASTHR